MGCKAIKHPVKLIKVDQLWEALRVVGVRSFLYILRSRPKNWSKIARFATSRGRRSPIFRQASVAQSEHSSLTWQNVIASQPLAKLTLLKAQKQAIPNHFYRKMTQRPKTEDLCRPPCKPRRPPKSNGKLLCRLLDRDVAARKPCKKSAAGAEFDSFPVVLRRRCGLWRGEGGTDRRC